MKLTKGRPAANSSVLGAAADGPALLAAGESPALDQLRRWTRECSSLRVFLVVSNPKKFMSYISNRLDGKPGLSTSELGDKWYLDMLVGPRCTKGT